MTNRRFTNPNYGNEVRVEIDGCEVMLTFIASDEKRAQSLAENILHQLKQGAVNISLVGKPTSRKHEH
jgi:hypothetical protein